MSGKTFTGKPLPLDEQRSTAVVRNCLKCSKDFQSIGDRICPDCAVSNNTESRRMSKAARMLTRRELHGISNGPRGS